MSNCIPSSARPATLKTIATERSSGLLFSRVVAHSHWHAQHGLSNCKRRHAQPPRCSVATHLPPPYRASGLVCSRARYERSSQLTFSSLPSELTTGIPHRGDLSALQHLIRNVLRHAAEVPLAIACFKQFDETDLLSSIHLQQPGVANQTKTRQGKVGVKHIHHVLGPISETALIRVLALQDEVRQLLLIDPV